jgi:hypothetical protein
VALFGALEADGAGQSFVTIKGAAGDVGNFLTNYNCYCI